jgi:hypothetical protein
MARTRHEDQAIGLRFREQGLDAVLHARGEGAEASGLHAVLQMRPVTHMRGVSMRRMRRSMVAASVTPSAIRR